MRLMRQFLERTRLGGAAAAVALLASSAFSPALEAQAGSAVLEGLVFDSTSMQPLAGARVAVMGTSAIGESDAEGRFRIPDVPAGSYWVTFFHARLQELGVNAPSRQVAFLDGDSHSVQLSG